MDKALYERGMAMRRKVLGDEYVDRAIANTDDFNRKFQDLLNEFCWGAVWTDEDLKPRDRSLLNLGMIACLGRMHEFEAHFRGALRNGLTPQGTLRDAAAGRDLLRLPGGGRCHRVAKQVWRRKQRKARAAAESSDTNILMFRRCRIAWRACRYRAVVLNVPSSRAMRAGLAARGHQSAKVTMVRIFGGFC